MVSIARQMVIEVRGKTKKECLEAFNLIRSMCDLTVLAEREVLNQQMLNTLRIRKELSMEGGEDDPIR